MAVTKEMQRELSNKARMANRRLERATKGQRDALEYYIRNYHTRTNAEGEYRFNQGKAKTEAEYNKRMEELRKFESGQTSTRKGWDKVIADSVHKANEKLQGTKYEGLSDEELATIAKETGGHNNEFYRALENAVASKLEMYDEMTDEELAAIDGFIQLTEAELLDIIYERVTDQQATERLLRQRQKGSKKNVPTGSKRRK